ncbi:MAG TPA: hypothetical protein DCE81_02445, partial [Cytophagales bacterium]|nr:hypothetical protein [Cytophagales bacterium]
MALGVILLQLFVVHTTSAQCAFSNLNAQYCVDQPAFSLTGGTNYFGPGVSGSTFNPASAGVGTHTLITTDGNASGYFVSTSGTFAPLSGSGTALALGNDDEVTGVPIGFTFNFFGLNYSQVRVGDNGIVGFSSSVATSSNLLLPDPTAPNNIIAASWDDMIPDGSSTIEYFTTGSAPFRKFIVNYTNLKFSGNADRITVQVQLHETTNIVELHSTGITAGVDEKTQGIQNGSGSIAYFAPGRNFTNFTATNDFVQFRPQCLDIRTVTINALPQDKTVTPVLPTTVCSGQTVTLTVVSSQSGINYEILDQSGTVVSGIVVGTGGDLNITSSALSTSVTSLRIRATNASTTCSRLLDGADAVVVNAIPSFTSTLTPAA